MLDQHELAWLLAACEELPDFGEEDRPFDYLEALFITVLDFHSRGEMVEKALDHYTATARAKLKLTGHQSLLKWLARYDDNQAELHRIRTHLEQAMQALGRLEELAGDVRAGDGDDD